MTHVEMVERLIAMALAEVPERRRKLTEAAGDALRSQLSRWFAGAGVNQLSVFPELAGRAVCAVDGHYIEHACHSRRT